MLTLNIVWALLEIKSLRKGRSLLSEDIMLYRGKRLPVYPTLCLMIMILPAVLYTGTVQAKYYPKQTRNCYESFCKRRGKYTQCINHTYTGGRL